MITAIDIHQQIGSCCTTALLYEVYTSLKPGLVDRISNGAHTDMDLFTFLESIAAISPYFKSFAEIGYNLDKIDETSLAKIRPLGIECEKAMFNATKGVNTHKGAIFSLGILATAAGYCYKEGLGLSANTICHVSAKIAKAAEKDFLLTNDTTFITNGLKLYAVYGIRGIRGEAASGFYSVRTYALPVMQELILNGGYSKNHIYLQVLLHLMMHVVDTNVIARCGIEAMEYVKSSARNVISIGGALSFEGKEELFRMDEDFTRRNISPGGCADLLSVAILLHLLENTL
ncbi:MAG TPA: triphosphoribosyl-dephospho-CoA synthase CitG [Thermoanaerobacterales bacterium]|nr:triphosphoribosyl-dephospho-CoA synthase CitG [Thermoanaerobacterales bacterium]